MNARHEIKRLRRLADDHEYHAIELRARAKALEVRDATYAQAMTDGGHELKVATPLRQRLAALLGYDWESAE